MKPSTKKDCGGGTGASPPILSSCFDVKPFLASLGVLTFVMAMWQLQPYESFFSSRYSSCAVANGNTTTTYPSPQLPKQKISSSLSSSSVASWDSTITAPTKIPQNNLSVSLSLTSRAPSNSTTPVSPQKHKFSSSSSSSSSVSHSSTTSPTTARAPIATSSDPNKRIFRAYGSAASLFVHMGAYRGGPRTFAIVGLASKPTHVYGTPYFKCEWMPNSNPSRPIRTKAYKILPDWGYGRIYTVVVVNCTFPFNPNVDNSGGKLLVHAYYSTSSRRYEKFVALEEVPGSYKESMYSPPFKYEYLYCGSSLYGNLSASRMREWMAYHAHFFGPNSHFVFHDAGGVGPAVRGVLEPWVKAGWVTIQDIRAQVEYDGYYYNQFLVVNDCLHRYRHAANWTFFFDVDEYLYLPNGHTLQSVLRKLSPYTQFTIEQNPMSSKLCLLDPSEEYSRKWGFEKLVFRNSITGVRRDRKYAIQARNAYATGVHMSQNVKGRTTHKTEYLIRYYHYHNSINVLGEPCQEFVPVTPEGNNKTLFQGIPYVYDDNMKHIADKIKLFEKKTIGSTET